jgi:hypothetical protein
MSSEDPRDLGSTYETLRRLERRLDEASRAAERVIAEAAAQAASAASASAAAAASAASAAGRSAAGRSAAGARSGEAPTPPAGWQLRGSGASAAQDGTGERDVELLAQVLQSVRELIPPDLQRRLAEALREVLLALRALIDWYLERLERSRSEPVQVQDIPIV